MCFETRLVRIHAAVDASTFTNTCHAMRLSSVRTLFVRSMVRFRVGEHDHLCNNCVDVSIKTVSQLCQIKRLSYSAIIWFNYNWCISFPSPVLSLSCSLSLLFSPALALSLSFSLSLSLSLSLSFTLTLLTNSLPHLLPISKYIIWNYVMLFLDLTIHSLITHALPILLPYFHLYRFLHLHK